MSEAKFQSPHLKNLKKQYDQLIAATISHTRYEILSDLIDDGSNPPTDSYYEHEDYDISAETDSEGQHYIEIKMNAYNNFYLVHSDCFGIGDIMLLDPNETNTIFCGDESDIKLEFFEVPPDFNL